MQIINSVIYIKDIDTLRKEYEKAQKMAKELKKDYDNLNEHHGQRQDDSDQSSGSDEENEKALDEALIDLDHFKEKADRIRKELRDAGGARDSDPRGLDTPSDSDDFDYGAPSSSGDSDSEGDDGNNNNGGVGLPVEKEDNSSLPDAENLPDAKNVSNWSQTVRDLWKTVCDLLNTI